MEETKDLFLDGKLPLAWAAPMGKDATESSQEVVPPQLAVLNWVGQDKQALRMPPAVMQQLRDHPASGQAFKAFVDS
jgi:hypothetical protein